MNLLSLAQNQNRAKTKRLPAFRLKSLFLNRAILRGFAKIY